MSLERLATEKVAGAHIVLGGVGGMEIRQARPGDLGEMQAIYAHHVLNGTGTFEEEPPPVEEMGARLARCLGAGHAWVVAADETGVLGFGYYGPFHQRSAWRHTVEDSIYVREDVRGQGVGKALVGRLVEEASRAGLREIVALIGDSDNAGSIGVHASLGFSRCGVLRGVGEKFGRPLDVVIMQLRLPKTAQGSAADPEL